MKMNGGKKRNTAMFETKAFNVSSTLKDECSTGDAPSIEVIELSDSEESSKSSQEETFTNQYQINRIENEQENPTSSSFETSGSFINQLLQLDGNIVCEEVDLKENPNEIFLCEDFELEETNGETNDSTSSTEQTMGDQSSKFFGISKRVRARCSTCKIHLKNIGDDQLRYLRRCMKCQSPMLFQCRKCAKFYSYFQSVWDHVMRGCRRMEISPTIAKLALKAADERDRKSSIPVVTLDSEDVKFVNCESTLPFRIESVESGIQIATDEVMDIEIKKFATSLMPRFSEEEGVYYQCYKCESTAKSTSDIQHHIAYAHYERFSRNGFPVCSRCNKQFQSWSLKEHHEAKCRGSVSYDCKFCSRSTESPTEMRNHLTTKHSELYKEHELNRIVAEMECRRKVAEDILMNACKKEASNAEKSEDATMVKAEAINESNPVAPAVKEKVNEKLNNFSKINELLKIRCCKCKVTFEKVAKNVIHRCPDCLSELLYSCRSCNKLFAWFEKAWEHVACSCKPPKIRRQIPLIIKKKSTKKHSKASKPAGYSCRHCDFTSAREWQVSQHTEMGHSCLNGDDLEIKFTACSRCGRAFEKPEECAVHEQQHCGKEMLLICEFCPRVETRVEPMRIHLAMMHLEQLGSLSNLEDVMKRIKTKRRTSRGIRALPVPNQPDEFMEVEEC